MSAPSYPSLSDLIDEGFEKAGVDSPSSALTSRATNAWMAEIKDDISDKSARKLKPLYTERIKVCTIGQSKYDNPSDFFSDMSLEILDGDSNTAQSGTSSTITLSSTETNTDLIGREIVITSGAGLGQIRQIIGYNSSTKVATVSDDFSTAPDSTSGYMIVKYKSPVYDSLPANMVTDQNMMQVGKATRYYPVGNSAQGSFILGMIPDKAYPLRQRYFADLKRIDVDGDLMATLYDRWRTVWTLGIAKRAAFHENTVEKEELKAEYLEALYRVIPKDIDGKDVNRITEQVTDY